MNYFLPIHCGAPDYLKDFYKLMIIKYSSITSNLYSNLFIKDVNNSSYFDNKLNNFNFIFLSKLYIFISINNYSYIILLYLLIFFLY